jgi:hypothetical protein
MAVQRYVASVITLILMNAEKYSASVLCNVLQQVEYGSGLVELQNDSSMQAWGFNYPPGTFWKEDEETYIGCPCLMKKCIQHCSSQ